MIRQQAFRIGKRGVGGLLAVSAAATVLYLTALPAAGQDDEGGGRRGDPTAHLVCPTYKTNPVEFHRCALEKEKTFKPPMTAWGKPDFRGRWNKTRLNLFIEEIKAGQFGVLEGEREPLASMIVDPKDGLIPYHPWARKIKLDVANKYISNSTHCMPLGPLRYVMSISHGADIIQEQNLLTFVQGRTHYYRMIPLDGRRPLANNVKTWLGISRGHWEGNTLVVEVTNINDLTWMDHYGTFHSPDVRMIERFTYFDKDAIHYEQTIIDPKTFTQPWKISLPMIRGPFTDLWEDAESEGCHFDLDHYYSQGMVPFPGWAAVAPKQ